MTSGPPRMWAPTTLYILPVFVAAGVLIAVQSATGPDPNLLELVQFAPAVAVAAVLLAWRGRWAAPRSMSLRRPDATLAAAAAGSALAVLALPAAALIALGGSVSLSAVAQVGAAPIALLVLAQCLGACGEEVGWRGFLQPYLRTRYSVLVTGVLVGALWGVWHVQIFTAGIAYATCFLASTIALPVLLAVLLEPHRRGNLLVATLFHAVVNLGLLTFGETSGQDPRVSASMAVGAASCAAAITAIRRRGAQQLGSPEWTPSSPSPPPCPASLP